MVTVKCQYTGIEFEAATKRTKNHPLVSAFLNEANADKHTNGAYRKALEILEELSGQYESIEPLMAEAKSRYTEWKDGAAEQATSRRAVQRQAEQAKADAKARRAATNARLKAHGYRWVKEDEESMDYAGPLAFEQAYGNNVSYVWVLVSPDGREVSVEEALSEISEK